MQLPIMASPEDMMQFAKYLNTKVSGSTIEDAKAAIDKKLLDPRKVNAYTMWGMLVRDADKIKLSDRGKRLVKSQSLEEIAVIYQEVIREIEAYAGVIEWVHYRDRIQAVTNVEVAEYWHETKKYDMTNENDNTLKDRAVCFFKVCEAAGFGKMLVGRRGQPTRLELKIDEIMRFMGDMNANKELKRNEILDPDLSETVEYKENTRADEVKADVVSLPIPFIDGRSAVLKMPKNANKEDAQYVFDMLHLILSRQYGLDK